MKYSNFAATIAIALSVVVLADAQEKATSQFVLLKNNQVVEGVVDLSKSTPKSLVINKSSGSQIYLDRDKVVTVANSRQSIYWDKCAALSPTDVSGHTSLYSWCVEHDLFAEAQNQIDLLQMMRIGPSKLLNMSNSLDLARRIQKEKLQAEKFAMQKLPKTTNEKSNDLNIGKVQQVGYTAPIEISDRMKLIEKLERATDSIDGDAVVMFKRKIEPLLINSCYTAKCHSNDSMPLPLASLGKSHRVPKRMSQRNLYNVLKYADFERPMESKLLSAAVLPHAGQTKPIIKINTEPFKNLRVWLIGISSKPFIFHPVPTDFYEADLQVATETDDAKVQEKDKPNQDSVVSGTQPERAPSIEQVKKLPAIDNVTAELAKNENTVTDTPVVKSGTKISNPTASSDPFDPEVFNQRFRKQDTAETAEPTEQDDPANDNRKTAPQ